MLGKVYVCLSVFPEAYSSFVKHQGLKYNMEVFINRVKVEECLKIIVQNCKCDCNIIKYNLLKYGTVKYYTVKCDIRW